MTAMQSTEEGLKCLAPILREVEQYRLWELERYDIRRALDMIGVTRIAETLDGVPQLVDAYIDRLINGRPSGNAIPLIESECQAARANKLAGHGGTGANRYTAIKAECERARASALDGPKEGYRGNNITSVDLPKRGTAKTYTLRRLARDRPDLLDRVEAGGLERGVGMRRRTKPIMTV
jgi:hypothetical protein